jgi:hypothetical protein
LATICEGTHFGYAGVCQQVPFAKLSQCLFHFLIIASLIATRAGLRQRCEGSHLGVACSSRTKVRPFDYHFLIMASLVATCAELRTRCEGNRLGVACSSITMFLSPPYHLPIIASLIATRAGLRKRCEESHLGVAGGSPCDFLAVSLAFPYHGLAGCHKCRI